MENKYNESTQLRPEGDRVLNAPYVSIDLNTFITQIKQETTWTDSDHNSITVYKSDDITLVLVGMHTQAELSTHTAKGNVQIQLLSGQLAVTIEEQHLTLDKGQMIALQPNIPHSVQALEESFLLLTLFLTK